MKSATSSARWPRGPCSVVIRVQLQPEVANWKQLKKVINIREARGKKRVRKNFSVSGYCGSSGWLLALRSEAVSARGEL